MLEARLLGQFEVRRDGTVISIPARAAQTLLAYLLLTSGTAHRREKLAGILWPDTTEENARSNLRHELWRLRKAIEGKSTRKGAAPLLAVDEISIGINSESDYWLDVSVVQKPLPKRISADDLIKTLSLYRGELLPGWYDDWVELERARIQAAFEQKMARLLELLAQEERWHDTLEWGERWIALGQTPEPAFRGLMVAHSALGNVSQVAVVYERCVQAMRNDLGVEPSEQTQALFERLSQGFKTRTVDKHKAPAPAPQQVAAPSPPRSGSEPQPSRPESSVTPANVPLRRPGRLPVPLTSFIGRERERDELKQALATTRLLTLIGAGGLGKTRLAIQLAGELSGEYQDGVWWVDLVPLSDPGLVPQAVARALGVLEIPNVALVDTLADTLCSKQALLVLDNCEHLVAACAQLADSLLGSCASLKILSTSREALGISGETVWRVPSLGLPKGDDAPTTDELIGYESVRLFVDRAHAAHAGFNLTEQNALIILQICRRLDGIPLAIELAAARVKTLSVQQIATRLDDRFNLLVRGSRTALPRHQTLRAAIDWSYELLSEQERALFERLSVFAGGWTLEAAEAVCAGNELAQGEVLELLTHLIDKSLVIVDERDEALRYHMLETIRQYAYEKLTEAEEEETVHRRHLEFFLKLAEESEPKQYGAEQVVWLGRLEIETGNLRAAIEWSMRHRPDEGHRERAGRTQAGLRTVGALAWFFVSRYPREASQLLEEILKSEGAQERSAVRAKALNAAGFLEWTQNNFRIARPFLEEAMSISRDLRDKLNLAWALVYLGAVVDGVGDYVLAQSYLEEGLALARGLGDVGKFISGVALAFLGDGPVYLGQVERAQQLYQESILILRDIGDKNYLAYPLRRLGYIALHQGEAARAVGFFGESLRLNWEVGHQTGTVASLAALASAWAYSGESVHAARLFGAVAAFGNTIKPLLSSDRSEHDRFLEMARNHLTPAAFEAAWAEGKDMSMEQAVSNALSTADELLKPHSLPPNNLPIQLSSFVGRAREIGEIKRLLADARLLTLTGAGGVGKTRLALKLATESLSGFRDGVWWVDLVGLTDGALVPQAVASAVGVREVPNQPVATTLVNYLRSKQLLLVLDNCEHIIQACAQVATFLLSACPHLRLLTTSREALGITGETTWRVPSLSLPGIQSLPPVAKLQEYEGIRLFIERARAVKTNFVLTDQNAAPIVQICQRLDGIPLAIELAAARVGALSVDQIATRLDDRFSLLTRGSRTALQRHQTLRATIDWSYELLSELEKVLFRRLSVFAAGWTLEAAEAVSADDDLAQGEVLELLAHLLDKSLVIAEEHDRVARYHMLETIRQYAHTRLVEASELETIHRRHLDFFLQLAEESEPKQYGPEQSAILDHLELEIDNLRAAIDWALQNQQVIVALRLVSAIPRFWFIRAHHGEGLERLRTILGLPEAAHPSPTRLKALNAYFFMLWPADQLTAVQPLIEEALALGSAFEDRWNTAYALLWLGVSVTSQGNYPLARSYLEQSLGKYRELGDATYSAWALVFLGEVELLQGDTERAQALYEQAIPHLKGTKDYPFLAIPLRRVGQLALFRADLGKADRFIKDSLVANWSVCDYRGVGACLAALGALSMAQAQPDRAVVLFGAVDAVLEFIRTPLLPFDTQLLERNVADVRTRVDEAEFRNKWTEGHTMTLEQVVAFALQERRTDELPDL